jgi:hypothetical protein
MRLLAADSPPPAGFTPRQKATALAAATLLIAIAGFVIGQAVPRAAPDPVQLQAGVPVGVAHSPNGAVAAADEYLACEQSTVERDPARFSALVSEDYVSALRPSAVGGGHADRQHDPRGMRLWAAGGQSLTVIGAHRLDWYQGDRAQITIWAGQIFWGPGQAPRQVWALGRVDLVWQAGRWRVSSLSTLPSPAPAPAALPQGSSSDDSAAAFDSQLAGFSPVSYGSPQ